MPFLSRLESGGHHLSLLGEWYEAVHQDDDVDQCLCQQKRYDGVAQEVVADHHLVTAHNAADCQRELHRGASCASRHLRLPGTGRCQGTTALFPLRIA